MCGQAAICDIRDGVVCGFRNTRRMRAPAENIVEWVRRKVDAGGRGTRARLARHLNKRPEVLSRMLSHAGEKRGITFAELDQIADFFQEAPPLQVLRGRETGPTPSRSGDMVDVPVISWVSAGKLAEASTPIPDDDARMIGFSDLGRGDFFALQVQGDSMDRISPESSIIIVNRRDRRLVVGKAYVFSIRGEATYKVWRTDPRRLEPFSTNPTNQAHYKLDGLEVVGRVRRTVLDL
jgi:SOS-response transcriptional repressor LexA